jgi:tetratricopeptide (TPR) repeat protein
MEDVFAIQDDISSRIVDALKIRLLSPGESPRVKVHTRNLEAYRLYLKGRHYRWSRYDISIARLHYEKAVAEEPSYAPAYAGLADCYNHIGVYAYLPPDVARSKATEAIEKALSIDPLLGEVHAVLGHVQQVLEWKWSDAENAFQRAIELDPAFVMAYTWYSILLANVGRQAEAMAMVRKALELDPLSPLPNIGAAMLLWYEYAYESAVSESRRALEMHPNHPFALYTLGCSCALAGQHEESITVLEKLATLWERSSFSLGKLGWANAAAGRRGQALKIAGELEERAAREYVSPLVFAWTHGALGEEEEAFRYLEMAFEERTPFLTHLKTNRALFHEKLRSDPRFDDLARRMNLPL